MAQCSVYENSNPSTKGDIPYLLDVQSGLLADLHTRVVVPLYRQGAVGVQPLSRLTPVLSFRGLALVAMVPELAGVPRRLLGAEIGELTASRGALLQALDLLLTGF